MFLTSRPEASFLSLLPLLPQGYHDVAITFLLVTGEDMGFRLVEKLSITHLKEFMGPTMEKTNFYLTYLYPILQRANQKLYDCLVKYVVGRGKEKVDIGMVKLFKY